MFTVVLGRDYKGGFKVGGDYHELVTADLEVLHLETARMVVGIHLSRPQMDGQKSDNRAIALGEDTGGYAVPLGENTGDQADDSVDSFRICSSR